MSMRIVGLGTAVPDGRIDQEESARASAPLMCGDARQEKLMRGLYARSGVRTRHGVVVENAADGTPVQRFYSPRTDANDRGPGTEVRMREYEERALPLAVAATREALGEAAPESITHLVTVSCTGFFAPGLDIGLIRELGLSREVERTQVGFMGCHGLFNGLAVARALVEADPSRRVLVAAAELCSLHFQYGWDSQKLVANALFADGCAAVLCAGGQGPAMMTIEATGSFLLPDSEAAMSWRIRDHGFEMTLSPEVPALIRESVPAALDSWLARHGGDRDAIATWAVHPGGPRILTAFEEALALPEGALEVSRAILARYGNMSSATIGFILREQVRRGARGVGLAVGFGPGLVAELMLFRSGPSAVS